MTPIQHFGIAPIKASEALFTLIRINLKDKLKSLSWVFLNISPTQN